MKEEKEQFSSKGEVIIYKSKDNGVQIDVTLGRETVWLTQSQIADLFGTQRPAITKHLLNIFKVKELREDSVCSILEHTASDGKVYQTNYYNLDAIISIGYRVNSTKATQFRIWATNVLRKHLIEGYTINQKSMADSSGKLKALQEAIKLITKIKGKKTIEHKEALGLLEVISDYSYALDLLDDYDYKRLRVTQTSKGEKFKFTYELAIKVVCELKKKFGASNLFGVQKDQSFKSSITSIYQTFKKNELYPSIEEKAANLLYFVVKNHSFVDGNKRIAASIFLWFLEKNGLLYRSDKTKRIADNALVALTLMIAESDPAERTTIVALTVNLINRKN